MKSDEFFHAKKLSLPAVEPVRHYRYLIARPETGRQQLYLKGRNMSVGQLIYKMRTNQLTVQEAAEDMDLSIDQVSEVLAYYHTHRELIASEAESEKRFLQREEIAFEA